MPNSRSTRRTSHDTVFLHWPRPGPPMPVAEIMACGALGGVPRNNAPAAEPHNGTVGEPDLAH